MMVIKNIVITALLSIPRWLTVRVQVLSREHWNEVLPNLQTCGPGQARIRTIKVLVMCHPRKQRSLDAPCLVQLKLEPPKDVC